MIKRESYIYPNCTLKRMVDGDTLYPIITVPAKIDLGFSMYVNTAGEIIPDIRVLNLDTPEIFHPRNAAEKQHGLEAMACAIELLAEPFTIQSFKTSNKDNRGRYLASITLADGRDFATVMKEKGFQKREKY